MKLVLKIAGGILLAWAFIASIGIISFIISVNMVGKASEEMQKTIMTQNTPITQANPTQPIEQTTVREKSCMFTPGCIEQKKTEYKLNAVAVCEAKGLKYDQLLGSVYGDEDACVDLDKITVKYNKNN
jgi:hypothetical protein